MYKSLSLFPKKVTIYIFLLQASKTYYTWLNVKQTDYLYIKICNKYTIRIDKILNAKADSDFSHCK